MLSLTQFRDHIIKPTLLNLDLYSKAAERLLLGTALTESGLTFLKQFGEGPALGVYQMEPNTEQDIWNNYLNYRDDLADKIRELKIGMNTELIGNLYYATAMCRIHYLRVPKPLPDEEDIAAMSNYWKTYYNSGLGKGKSFDFVEKAKPAFDI
jgi:hypothetical protein